jgi:hypothetical protein
MATFTLPNYLNPKEIQDLTKIYKDNQPSPKSAIQAWVEERPKLVTKLTEGGLDLAYFSYSVEYVFNQSRV